jgi:hypothetical protein
MDGFKREEKGDGDGLLERKICLDVLIWRRKKVKNINEDMTVI